jgi:hypothetical protein
MADDIEQELILRAFLDSPAQFVSIHRCSGAVAGEVLVFDFRVVLNITVVTPQAPADNFAGIGVGAPALAMETRLLSLLAQAGEVDFDCAGLDFSHLLLVRYVFVLWTCS